MIASEPIQVTILHTNDMHSRLTEMSRLASFARMLRLELENQHHQVFFFDAGDAADRSIWFTGVTKGAAFPQILNAMGVDAQALGNAISVTYGPQAAVEMAKRADFPVLAANFFWDGKRMFDAFEPTAIFAVTKQVKLGVVGLTVAAPEIYRIFGFETQDFRAVTRFWVDLLKRQGIQAIVILSHLGLNLDEQLAAAVPEIDLIIGGHTHSTLPDGQVSSGVLIAQAGEYAGQLGRVDLSLDPQTGQVLSRQAMLYSIPNDSPPDPAVEAAIQAAEAEASQVLATPIAVLQQSLELDHFSECRIANLAADILRQRMGADIGLVCSGLFHQGLPAGAITLGELNSACFTTANPQLAELTGEQILQGLELAFDPLFCQKMLKSFRGTPIGIPAVSGMQLEYDPEKSTGQRIREVSVAGQPLNPQSSYLVAHTDAEMISDRYDGGFLKIDEGQMIQVDAPTILREALAEYMAEHSPVPAPETGRLRRIDR